MTDERDFGRFTDPTQPDLGADISHLPTPLQYEAANREHVTRFDRDLGQEDRTTFDDFARTVGSVPLIELLSIMRIAEEFPGAERSVAVLSPEHPETIRTVAEAWRSVLPIFQDTKELFEDLDPLTAEAIKAAFEKLRESETAKSDGSSKTNHPARLSQERDKIQQRSAEREFRRLKCAVVAGRWGAIRSLVIDAA